MKKGWLISFFVLFLCICAFSFNNFANAQIEQPSISAEKRTIFKNQTPVEVLDVLQRATQFSEASQEGIEVICNHYSVEGTVFKDLETKGYDFMTSARIIDLTNRYNVDLKTIEEYIQQGKDLDSLYPQNGTDSTLSSDTEFTGEYIKQIAPPKELENNYESYVNPQNGSYTFKQEEIVLPGRNGLDLVIAPRYNSASAIAIYSYYDQYETLKEALYKSWDEKIGFDGTGWSLGLPYIVFDYDVYWDLIPKYLCLPDGQSYTINLDNTVTGLYGYDFTDMKLSKVITNETSYKLLYKDGTKETFNSSGFLIMREDKYGNRILYKYMSNRLYQIVDTIGRIIQFNYITTETEKEIRISVPGNGVLTYIFEKVPEYKNDYKLVRKIDFVGRITEFSYSYDRANSYD